MSSIFHDRIRNLWLNEMGNPIRNDSPVTFAKKKRNNSRLLDGDFFSKKHFNGSVIVEFERHL